MSLPNDESVSLTEEAILESKNRDRLMLDVITSYALAIARVGSWFVVCGLVARTFGAEVFGLLALIRLSMTPVIYAGLNLGPAVVRIVSTWLTSRDTPIATVVAVDERKQSRVLDYATPKRPAQRIASPWHVARSVTLQLSILLSAVGWGLAWIFSQQLLSFPDEVSGQLNFNGEAIDNFFLGAMVFGVALAIRSVTEGLSGLLQIRRRLWLDNFVAIIAESIFVLICFYDALWRGRSEVVLAVSQAFAVSVFFLALMRFVLTETHRSEVGRYPTTDRKLMNSMVATGTVLTFAQLADYFYAPFALQLASRHFNPDEIASYSATLLIDAALLLFVAGIAAPLLARVTHAHIHHQLPSIRRIYIRASITAFVILLMGSLAIWSASDLILKLWLKEVPIGIAAILPLVLIHTTIGGASGVGRSVLIGMGKIRAWTISSLIGGISNALLVLLFVLVFDWGLKGIIFATIISVTVRCLIWMPWYILRHTKQFANQTKVAAPMADL